MLQCSFELNGKPLSDFVVGVTPFPAFSGLGKDANVRVQSCNANTGPIPPGKYYIFDRQSGGMAGRFRDMFNNHSEWFALYAIDNNIDDDSTLCDNIKRGAFRLHPKGSLGISKGCITVNKTDDFLLLRTILRNGKQTSVPGSSLKAYGVVTVR
jgi:Protein of unknown function (DUF2778)